MNPIYKFELSAGNATQRAYPLYKDDLAKDYEKESNQEFFRAKLSGKLTFQQDDYSFIISKAFDTQFGLEIFISYDGGQSWASYWRGNFWKTDCEFNDDDQTAIVTPSVSDRYSAVLAGMEKEYNLIDLAPEIVPVKADKRPMVQVYVPGQTVIGCFLSGMWWEQECEAVDDETKLVNDYYFVRSKSLFVVDVSGGGSISLPRIFTGDSFNPMKTGTQDYTNEGYTFRYANYAQPDPDEGGFDIVWSIIRNSDSKTLWSKTMRSDVPPQLPYQMVLTPVSGSGATGNVTLYLHTISVYSRLICDTKTIVTGSSTQNTYEIPADDIVENNRNYTRVIGYDFPDSIIFSTTLVATPTKWGIYQPGQYYFNPVGLGEVFPVARNAWGLVSIWFVFSTVDWLVESSARRAFTIRDAYPLASVISVLLSKIAPGITHEGTTDYSKFLYDETNPITNINQRLFITPKSNLVTAGYDQPAQKAPITLKRITDMLRDCFRCYWFIDEQNRFRIEHIQYFRNGGSYSISSDVVVGINLTTQKVSRNGKEWAFARNQYEFDKPEMAARYQFGWMDDVTELFNGYPIDIISNYVNPDNIEQIDVSQFTSDVDYILLNPSEISKDGFVLLAGTEIKESKTYATQDWQSLGAYSAGTYRITCISGSVGSYMLDDGQEHPLVYGPGEGGQITIPDTNNFKIYTIANTTIEITALSQYKLQYENFKFDETDHILQNAWVSFMFLQRYYAYDMPAYQYKVNNEQMRAYGIKKLKTQSIRFPILTDPDLMKLVKTNLGNGTIEKLSINLSSRSANATLKYDTE